ncbi:DoxX family protein [Phyllobacterium sp. BT25]|uniref:DoxX family protein n=1 Tax=Phyllobacterium pellucidum TaxID=2740464 RepID=A0A849VXS8_9HYPH|nr:MULTISPECIES: DoxX family protein [Phyllobacterium]NTS33097.1 DoxX family protein [Phyllobacterium pellucidum]UGY11408.1 DoxX family protein [Phyllobacterium sp. T1018]SFJ27143.1 putative oxidoreductase [Phyllobacterium sp. CL33Tsu]
MERLQAPLALLARLFLAYIFVVEGWSKISAYSATASYMQTNGVTPGLLPLVILTELGGGLLIAAGFMTRYAALALAGFCLLTALLFHSDFGNIEQVINFNKNIAIAGGFLALMAFGPGAWSIDAMKRGVIQNSMS